MSRQRLSAQQLPYREMERLRQVRRGAGHAWLCHPVEAGSGSRAGPRRGRCRRVSRVPCRKNGFGSCGRGRGCELVRGFQPSSASDPDSLSWFRRQFRRDVIKAIPVGIIAIPPFANFLVIVLM